MMTRVCAEVQEAVGFATIEPKDQEDPEIINRRTHEPEL
jgi:hypothetical protein